MVDDAWPIDDGFCVVYRWADDDVRIGVRLTRESQNERGAPFWYQHWLTSDYPNPTPEEFGMEIADLAIAEPGPVNVELNEVDGIGWWGQSPLPGSHR